LTHPALQRAGVADIAVNPAKIQPGGGPRPQKPSLFDWNQRQITARNSEQEQRKNSRQATALSCCDFAFSWHCAVISVQVDSSAGAGRRGQQIALRSPSFRTRPSKNLHYRYQEKYLL
jgi:hypothetical protein